MTFLKKICPVCAIVVATWLVMFAFKLLGYDVNDELLAMLMGGSAVGISYTLSTRLRPVFRTSMTVYWKLVAIPLGFAAMYAALQFAWWYVAGAAAMYALAWAAFNGMFTVQKNERHSGDVTKALDNCCD